MNKRRLNLIEFDLITPLLSIRKIGFGIKDISKIFYSDHD